jgi:zinc transport system substrate-binding protein
MDVILSDVNALGASVPAPDHPATGVHANMTLLTVRRFAALGLPFVLGSTLAAGLAHAGTGGAGTVAVVATIKPIHSLVAQVMGDTGEPRLLVGGAASPHTYALKPSDAKALNGARLVFRVSEQIEPFTRRIVSSLPKSVTVVTLADAPGLRLLDVREGSTFERHDHDDDHAHGHDHKGGHHDDHDHNHDGGKPSGKTVRDGHVWLDPANAVAMVREIARALKEAAPEQAAIFDANADKAIADIEQTARQIEADIAPLKNKPFVVFHDAYQYFESRFGITAIGSITVSPEVQPSAKRISEIRNKIKDLKAVCVFAEPQFKSKLVATVLEGTDAKAGTLDPEGASVEPGPAAYTTLLRNLAGSLKSCLA